MKSRLFRKSDYMKHRGRPTTLKPAVDCSVLCYWPAALSKPPLPREQSQLLGRIKPCGGTVVNMKADGESRHSFAHSLFIQQALEKTFCVVGIGPETRAKMMNRRIWSLPWGRRVQWRDTHMSE